MSKVIKHLVSSTVKTVLVIGVLVLLSVIAVAGLSLLMHGVHAVTLVVIENGLV